MILQHRQRRLPASSRPWGELRSRLRTPRRHRNSSRGATSGASPRLWSEASPTQCRNRGSLASNNRGARLRNTEAPARQRSPSRAGPVQWCRRCRKRALRRPGTPGDSASVSRCALDRQSRFRCRNSAGFVDASEETAAMPSYVITKSKLCGGDIEQ